MKIFLSIVIICTLMCCSPKNAYYKQHLSEAPYNVFFEAKQQSPTYKVSGKNDIGNNTFNAVLPDSLGGVFAMGDCVIEVQRNDIENRTTGVYLVGIIIHNREVEKFIGFDRYHQTLTRVQYKPSDSIKIYIPFIKQIVEGWTFQKNHSDFKSKDFAYCKIIFPASKQ